MRIEIAGDNVEVRDVLRTYAKSRVWLAVRRVASNLSWVAVRFLREEDRGDERIACQLDAWVRGSGLVTVSHFDVNAYASVDCAAVRLEQAVIRKLREAGQVLTRQPASGPTAPHQQRLQQRYAVVVVPKDAPHRLSRAARS